MSVSCETQEATEKSGSNRRGAAETWHQVFRRLGTRALKNKEFRRANAY